MLKIMSDSNSFKEAALSGDVEFLSRHLDRGFDVNNKDNVCDELFYLAYRHGNKDFIRKLLEAGLDIDFVIVEDLLRAQRWQTDCLSDILWFKVYKDVLRVHGKQYKALFHACFKRDYHNIGKFLRQARSCWKPGVSAEESSVVFSALLFLLIIDSECHHDLLQMVIESGANVDASFHGFRICDYAVLGRNVNGLRVLMKNDCTVDGSVRNSFSIFRHAVIFSIVDCLELLLGNTDLGRSPCWNDNGSELLELAVRYGKIISVDVLLKFGASVVSDNECEQSDSPLIIASKFGNPDIVNLLLKHGANVNVRNNLSETPLIYTAVGGFCTCLNMLIAHNADINAVDCDDQSALMHAVQRGYRDCVSSLLAAGADTSIANNQNETALMHAMSLTKIDCLELLLSSKQFCGASLNLNKFHQDAFALALRQFDVEKLLVLLKYGLFSWRWLDRCEVLPTEILARVLIASNVTPGHFQISNTGSPITLFQSALAAQDVWTAYFILINLYLDEYDCKYLQHNNECLFHNQNLDVLSLLGALSSQPLSLQTLCVVNLHVSLSYVGEKKRQEIIINSLPVPDKFKNLLRFQGPYSNLCVDHWKTLGREMSCSESFDWLFAFKPMCFDFKPCKEKHCGDNPAGFRMRYNLLKQRTQRR